jgi:putative GTP pyrophosphokinase
VQLSRSQIDRLGEKLRAQTFHEEELRALDDYRRTFGSAYDSTVDRLRRVLGAPVSGRPAKSTNSIIEKLNRETLRLSQMQDIAGCRVVVADVIQQNETVESLKREFPEATVVDRRVKPSHGYRAVHVIVTANQKPIEVQIRTFLQHAWAELCEKFADVVDPAIKYGGGPSDARRTLDAVAMLIARIEAAELAFAGPGKSPDSDAQELRQLREEYERTLTGIIKAFAERELES